MIDVCAKVVQWITPTKRVRTSGYGCGDAMLAKNERVDLSQEERNEFRELTKVLVKNYGRKKR